MCGSLMDDIVSVWPRNKFSCRADGDGDRVWRLGSSSGIRKLVYTQDKVRERFLCTGVFEVVRPDPQ